MTFSIPFARNRLGWLAVGLVGLQIAFKLLVEIRLAFEAQPALGAMAVGYTLGWIVVVGLCVTGNRLGYWAGAMLGLGHFVLTAALPLTGACDHFLVAGIVMSHGLLISIACLAVLL